MKNEIKQEFEKLTLQTRKALEEMGITFEVYSQMVDLLEQVAQQTSSVTANLSNLSDVEIPEKEDQEIGS